jgi:hypothetical protein
MIRDKQLLKLELGQGYAESHHGAVVHEDQTDNIMPTERVGEQTSVAVETEDSRLEQFFRSVLVASQESDARCEQDRHATGS